MTGLRLLVTRPQPHATRTAALLRERGHLPLVAPLLRFVPLAHPALGNGPWSGLLMTSASAAEAVRRIGALADWRHLPMLTVGATTAAAARAIGFTDVTSADGDAGDLARLARVRFGGAPLPLLYLAAEDRAADLAAVLRPDGIAVKTAVLYRMIAAPRMPEDAAAALRDGKLDGMLHYSQRSAEAFVRCTARDLAPAAQALTHYCISEKVGAVLQASGAANVRNAKHPDELALLDLLTT